MKKLVFAVIAAVAMVSVSNGILIVRKYDFF